VLRLAWLDVRRVAKAARAGELNHETLDDGRLVLTDSTARLQEFMSRDDSVFLAPIEYRRKQ
jgi:hypothetical protein